jgi:tRNA(Ile)-lysidine synthase
MRTLLKQQLQQQGIRKEETVLLAVSGGVDSMVLWALFREIGQKHAIAHLNFSLRGKESDADEALVREQALRWKVPHHFSKVDTQQYAEEQKLSIQMAAREIRYKWFEKLINNHQYAVLATAHHLEDSIETFLINLNRGTGLKGLRGITSDNKVIRPLLACTKEEIRAYAEENKVLFREDSSNSSLKYERNWFRHQLVGLWKQHNPTFLSNMQNTLKRLDRAQSMLEDYCRKEGAPIIESLREREAISFQQINALKFPLEILYYTLHPFSFTEEQLRELLRCIEDKKVGRQFLSVSHQLTVDREEVFINELQESTGGESTWLKKEDHSLNYPLRLYQQQIDRSAFEINTSKEVEHFAAEKLKYPLELRKWRKGDSMIPLGMKGKKKISDILIDAKVPLKDKDQVYVLCSGENIVWLLGFRIDERYKVSASSKQIVQLRWKRKKVN